MSSPEGVSRIGGSSAIARGSQSRPQVEDVRVEERDEKKKNDNVEGLSRDELIEYYASHPLLDEEFVGNVPKLELDLFPSEALMTTNITIFDDVTFNQTFVQMSSSEGVSLVGGSNAITGGSQSPLQAGSNVTETSNSFAQNTTQNDNKNAFGTGNAFNVSNPFTNINTNLSNNINATESADPFVPTNRNSFAANASPTPNPTPNPVPNMEAVVLVDGKVEKENEEKKNDNIEGLSRDELIEYYASLPPLLLLNRLLFLHHLPSQTDLN